jgi:hypothetical protein
LAIAWLSSGAASYLHGEGSEVTLQNASGEQVTGTVDNFGNVVTEDG